MPDAIAEHSPPNRCESSDFRLSRSRNAVSDNVLGGHSEAIDRFDRMFPLLSGWAPENEKTLEKPATKLRLTP